ncbi:P-loop containing nucleoside triphosphate hydrolase protein [Xylariales sp. AK1849]|nr:P-loop containing nucleoside triphosphate hydrolase protein [Xylariales sp. AK1849]
MSGGGWKNEPITESGGDTWNTNGDDAGQVDETGEEVKAAPPPLPFEHRDAPIAEWEAKPLPHDYEAISSGANGDWEGNGVVYEFDGEEGDIGPAYPDLELILFGNPEERDPQGIDFTKIAMIDVMQEGLNRIEPIKSFATAGLHPAMVRNIDLCGYRTPTPIQRYCIPAVKMGHDIIAIAQTGDHPGSGKTAAYLIPILNLLMGKAKKLAAPRPDPQAIAAGAAAGVTAEPLVVIVCPARELAIQIFNEARKFCYRTMLRPCVAYGGGPLRDQIAQLQKGCDVLIASPGRLIDLMERPHILTLRRVKYMVIDEADEMLHQDWEEEFNKILSGGEQEEGNIKYMLFSATFPTQIRKLAKTHLAASHVRIRVGRIGSTHENIKQDIIWVDPFIKKRALLDLLFSLEPGRIIIFVNNKRTADELDDYLFQNKMPCTSMHADRTQREREDSMRAFRHGKTPILVTTGVSARGIDVKNIKHVINYDLPSMDHGGITEYIHRIGRTARIGHRGSATSFYTERDEPIAEILTKTLLETKQEIPDFLKQYVPEGEELETLKFEPDSDEESEAGDDAGEGGGGGWGGDDVGGDAGGGDNWGAGGDTDAGAFKADASGGD